MRFEEFLTVDGKLTLVAVESIISITNVGDLTELTLNTGKVILVQNSYESVVEVMDDGDFTIHRMIKESSCTLQKRYQQSM